MNSTIDGYSTVKIALLAGIMLAVPCSRLLEKTWLRRSGRWPLADAGTTTPNLARTPPSAA